MVSTELTQLQWLLAYSATSNCHLVIAKVRIFACQIRQYKIHIFCSIKCLYHATNFTTSKTVRQSYL